MRIQQSALAIFDADDVSGQLGVTFLAEAHLAHHTVEVGGRQGVADSGALSLELGRVTGDASAAHHIGVHIHDVVSRGIDVVGTGLVDATLFGFIEKLFLKLAGAVVQVPPVPGHKSSIFTVAAQDLGNVGVGKNLAANQHAVVALAAQLFHHLGRALRQARKGKHTGRVALQLGDVGRQVSRVGWETFCRDDHLPAIGFE